MQYVFLGVFCMRFRLLIAFLIAFYNKIAVLFQYRGRYSFQVSEIEIFKSIHLLKVMHTRARSQFNALLYRKISRFAVEVVHLLSIFTENSILMKGGVLCDRAVFSLFKW